MNPLNIFVQRFHVNINWTKWGYFLNAWDNITFWREFVVYIMARDSKHAKSKCQTPIHLIHNKTVSSHLKCLYLWVVLFFILRQLRLKENNVYIHTFLFSILTLLC